MNGAPPTANLHNFHIRLQNILKYKHCPFIFPISIFEVQCPRALRSPKFNDILELFSKTIWDLCSNEPDYEFCGNLRTLYDAICHGRCYTPHARHERWFSMHLGILSACLYCLESRAKLMLGVRNKKKLWGISRCFIHPSSLLSADPRRQLHWSRVRFLLIFLCLKCGHTSDIHSIKINPTFMF